MTINTELRKQVLDAVIELYTIDLNPCGVDQVFYLTPTPDGRVDRRNLLIYTEDFRNTTEVGSTRPWSQFNDANNEIAVTTGHLGPFGEATASKLTATTGLQVQRQVSQTASPNIAHGSYVTASVYVKAAECTFFRLYISTRTSTINYPYVSYDLTAGVVQSVNPHGGFTPINAQIENVGGGWYRCSMSLSDIGTGGSSGGSIICQLIQSNGGAFDPVAAGEGLFLWGAQLELGPMSHYQPVGASWEQAFPDAIYYDGTTYIAFPIRGDGFETSTNGAPPQPTLRVSNVTKYVQSYLTLYQDLVGAKVTRLLTFKSLLDTPGETFGTQTFLISQLVSQTKEQLEFKLSSVLDNKQRRLPREQVLRTEFPGAGLFRER